MKTYFDTLFSERINDQLSANGMQDRDLSPQELFGLDQFHLGGPEPISQLLQQVSFPASASLLDLGSGLGGTSRLVAARTDATILGIDQEASFVAAADDLTKRCQLGDRISFQTGDITDLDTGGKRYDGAFLAHVQMNIADKQKLFSSIHRALKPGAPLLMWEVFSDAPEKLVYPLPWALESSESHLVSADAAKALLQQAGFTLTEWYDKTEWAKAWGKNVIERGPSKGLSLPAALPRGKERLANLFNAFLSESITVIQGVVHA